MAGSFDSWKVDLVNRLEGAPLSLIKSEFHAALNEFCRRSSAWIVTLNAVTKKADKAEYYLNPQPDGTVLYVIGYYVFNDSDTPRFYRLRQVPAQPAYCSSFGTIKFVPTPTEADEGNEFYPYVAMMPKNNYVPDEAEQLWYDILLDGVIGRMRLMSGRPWADKATSTYHLRRFNTGISQQRDMARRRYSAAESEWIYPQTWAG